MWDAVSQAWKPKNSHKIKHNSLLLGFDYFFKLTMTTDTVGLLLSVLPFVMLVNFYYILDSSVQPLSRVWLFVIPWAAAHQASLSIINSQRLLKLMSIESVMPSKHLTLFRPLLLPSVFPSIKVFSKEQVLCIRWPKDWRFSFKISPSNEHSGLISFRVE